MENPDNRIYEEKIETSKNSCLAKSDYSLSDSNFHIFNECIHEFLNKVLSTVIPQADQPDKIQTDIKLSNDASNNFEKIAKVQNGIVMIDSSELFDLNYGQTDHPFHSCQSTLHSFDIECNVDKTPIVPNSLLPSPATNLITKNNNVFVLSDNNSSAFIKYMPTVIPCEKGLTNIQNRLRLANLTNLPERASKTILFLQAGDASRARHHVAEPVHKYIQSSSTSLCLDTNLQYHWTSLENFYLSRKPFITVGHNISNKNIQFKKLIYFSHVQNFPLIVHIATVWHTCRTYEMIQKYSNMNATLRENIVHNWMNKKETESFVKVLNILTELQGISNGLMQVVTIVGFQHIYHPVYAIKQHCSFFYHISSFDYITYYEKIRLQKDDYSKYLAPYGSFYSIYASDCGDLVCSKHANITGGTDFANNDTTPKSEWGAVEYPSFGVRVCNVCTSVETLQTLPSISSLSSRTYKSSSTVLTKNKKQLTIFCHKQPVTVQSESAVKCLRSMAGDVNLSINLHYPIELKDTSTSSVSIQRLDVETKMKRNVLLVMYIALVVIIFSMLSLPQILATILY